MIRKYNPKSDEAKLMSLILTEGDEWSCYTSPDVAPRYKNSLRSSITYVAYDGETLCGYSRSINDFGFYVYVCDLLVMKEYRGQHIGGQLMECIYEDYPEQTVYVMSDVDPYYEKQKYEREGSIFKVPNTLKV